MLLICDYLLPGEPVWDFCCDHGYMGLRAYHSGDFPEIHFVDQVPHIIEQLENRFRHRHQRDGLTAQVSFWPESGENLRVPLKGTAIIAGVGAHTILQILRGLIEREQGLQASRLVLGPHNDEEFLEHSLASWQAFQKGFKLAANTQVQEGSRTRKLLIFDKVL